MALRPAIRFRFTVDKGRAIRRGVLAGMRNALIDLTWAWVFVGEAVARWHAKVMDSEGATSMATNGQPWTPLHEVTVKMRLLHARVSRVAPFDYLPDSSEGPEGRILRWSGRLYRALSEAGMGPNRIRQGTRRAYTWGVQGVRHWALLHAGGVNETGKTLPARPFVDPQGGAAVGVGMLELALKRKMGGV